MCRFILILILICVIIPVSVFASCRKDGVTVVYVNGIFTDEENAKIDKKYLDFKFNTNGGADDVTFINGYNPSHLGGVGDMVQVVSQALGSSMNDFDLKTILMQIHSEITTQKILLVGHSQGTFYTNEMYNYLTGHGVPAESIAVYNIATPASSVSGGGKYLTSGNDNLVNTVREWVATVDASQPLPANILLPPSSNGVEEIFRGHAFSREYLAKGSGFIISDINSLLDKLESRSDSHVDVSEGCYEVPANTFSYGLQKVGFAVSDPFV